MAVPTLPDIVRCSFDYLVDIGSEAHTASNVFHVLRDSGTASDSECQAIADNNWASWVAHFKGLTSSAFTLVRATAQPYRGVASPVFEHRGDETGTHAGTPLPPQVTWSITMRSALGNRRGRGRWFWAGLTQNQLSDPFTIENSAGSDMTAAIQALQSEIAGLDTGFGLAIFSRVDGIARYVTTDGVSPVDHRLDTQRRRVR
jgi:hypothetical protein